MKLDPLNLILDDSFKVDKIFYMISGNEITLMEKLKMFYPKTSLPLENLALKKLKIFHLLEMKLGCLTKQNLYIVKDIADLNDNKLNYLSNIDDKFIFFSENNPKFKTIKNTFIKRQDCALCDCYELTKDSKNKILKKFFNDTDIKIDDQAYWSLVDRSDNKYGFLENELNKIKEMKKGSISKENINSLISGGNYSIERIFFQIFGSNENLIKSYNQKITSDNEANNLYLVIKQFSNLILYSDGVNEFKNNVPKYLFREKDFLLNCITNMTTIKKRPVAKISPRK